MIQRDILPILTDFQDNQIGNFRLSHRYIRANFVQPYLPGEDISYSTISKIHSLHEGQMCWVETDPRERAIHEYCLKDVHGKILIGGLGLGVFFHYIPYYKKIDVIEKNQEVIDLVWPYFERKENVNIFHSSVEEFEPTEEYDFAYFDHMVIKDYKEARTERDQNIINPVVDKYSKNSKQVIIWGI